MDAILREAVEYLSKHGESDQIQVLATALLQLAGEPKACHADEFSNAVANLVRDKIRSKMEAKLQAK